ncbi:hypothetical protein DQ04_00731020 [Trypanosoma grayi]|uniref:hypothetical protein n=1 Tax=Trypanosoma grayi TaxID=71804 RepID=UPI0004F480C5|nr:hypothetical protein DQ04_00731020 [Trypanosoma grayi]KEG13880.1 hypothetical protein DQ04_00731020 [Trypanosoma grayi]
MTDAGPGSAKPEDIVKATADATSRLRDAMAEARRDPSKEIGISAEELQQRRKLASTPRNFVSEQTSRAFEVKSSARAQQIMNKGLATRQREMRKKEIAAKMTILRRMQVGVFVAGMGLLWWMGAEYLLPQYAAVQQRNRVLQLRQEMAQRKREEYARQRNETAQ